MRVFKRMGTVGGLLLLVMVGQLVVGTAQETNSSVEGTGDPGEAWKWQRSWEVFNLQTTAPDGWKRGEEIYYFKCWMCHNKYAKTGPLLHDLYQRLRLASGQPVSDETVVEKIKNGSPGMPAYGHTLTDADLDDLLGYLREKCCFEADEPPRNPRYRH